MSFEELPYSPMRGRMQAMLAIGNIPSTQEARKALRELLKLRREPSMFRALNALRGTVYICSLTTLGHRDEVRSMKVYAAKLECIRAQIPFKTIDKIFPEGPSCRKIMDRQDYFYRH